MRKYELGADFSFFKFLTIFKKAAFFNGPTMLKSLNHASPCQLFKNVVNFITQGKNFFFLINTGNFFQDTKIYLHTNLFRFWYNSLKNWTWNTSVAFISWAQKRKSIHKIQMLSPKTWMRALKATTFTQLNNGVKILPLHWLALLSCKMIRPHPRTIGRFPKISIKEPEEHTTTYASNKMVQEGGWSTLRSRALNRPIRRIISANIRHSTRI